METTEMTQQVHHAISAALKGRPASGEPAKESLHTAFVACLAADKGGSPSQSKVRDMARAGLEALLMGNSNPVEGSVEVMQGVVEVASRLNFDTEFMMRSALLGLAEVARRAPEGSVYSVKMALEESFMGLGEAFTDACRQVAASSIR